MTVTLSAPRSISPPPRTENPPSRHLTRRLLIEQIGPDRHLIFNPLSGAVDLATDADLQRLEALRHDPTLTLDPEEEQDLRQRRFLFETAADEERDLEASVTQAWSTMKLLQPEIYTICPTLACNLACSYCFEGDSLLDKQQGVMTEEQVDALFRAIAKIRENYALKSPFPAWIALFGGEPLLPSTHRAVAAICRNAAEGGFLLGGTTNGVNLVRFGDLLAEYADICTSFQVTLDGPQAMHDSRRHRLGGQGTFAEIVRGIDLLLSLEIGVDLRVNLDASNVSALPELIEFIHERGWDAHEAFQVILAPVTIHQDKGCAGKYDKAMSEMELAQLVLKQIDDNPLMADTCNMGFFRHLEFLVSTLEPEKLGRRRRGIEQRRPAPRYWYCEASTDKQFIFTPEGLIYSCSEAVGQPQHAIGRFDPELDIWKPQMGEWVGRTILSHPKCRECSISTLCGGGCNFAARERQASPTIDLLQIGLKGRASGPSAPVRASTPEPYCNAAEETVRTYLKHVGQRFIFS